jgi:hypothetical protein
MIRTDGIPTIANAETRLAEPARPVAPGTRAVQLTDAQWDGLVSLAEIAADNVSPVYDDERDALDALKRELAAR